MPATGACCALLEPFVENETALRELAARACRRCSQVAALLGPVDIAVTATFTAALDVEASMALATLPRTVARPTKSMRSVSG